MPPPVVEDWTYGPARWIGVGLIVALSAVGLSWSLTNSRSVPAAAAITSPKPQPPSPTAPARLESTPTPPKVALPAPIVTEIKMPEPVKLEAPSPSPQQPAPIAAAKTAKININAATQAELESLPNIGPKLAQRILDDRAKRGNYRSLADLDRVSGIGVKTLERLAPLITFE